MNTTPQITIIEVPSGLAISSPFNPKNNEVFKELHGHFERDGRRWILQPTVECKSKIAELFGEESPNVVARVTEHDFSICDKQLVLGGYVVASWDDRNNTIRMPAGVEIATGAWDVAASNEKKHPCLTVGSTLKMVVRKDFAETHGLDIEEELDEVEVKNPLRPYADSDLKVELEHRGYRVEKPVESFF